MAHLIYSRNANGSALTNERIAQLAPAVFSTSKAEKLTDRYSSLHTSQIIPIMQDYGYVPMQAAQKKSKKTSPEHSAHLLSFAKQSDGMILEELRPEIILYNSHDGSSAVKLFAGCFRRICSNGIIAGNGFNAKMYHNQAAMNGFEDMLRQTVDALPVMMQRIEELRATQLTYDAAWEMARQSVATRWELLQEVTEPLEGLEIGSYATESTIRDALRVNRLGDDLTDAFTVFNRIQESVVRGKAMIKSVTAAQPEGTLRKARPLNSVKEHIRVNAKLWDIADSFVKGAAAETSEVFAAETV